MKRAIVVVIIYSFFAFLTSAQETSASARPPQHPSRGPELLSFDELVTLSSTSNPAGPLAERLNALLTTPFVTNDAESGISPHRPEVGKLGPMLRVAFWNIERGLNFDLIRSALSDPDEFQRIAAPISKITDDKKNLVDSQLRTLRDADVLVLNEVDFGMKRTEYRDVAAELAHALRMNYVYAVEFVEVDPLFELGIEQVHLPDTQQDQSCGKTWRWTTNATMGCTGPPF